jgi:phosphate-selective porin OprO/OprP
VKTQSKLLLLATASLLVFGSAAQAQDAPTADAAEAPGEIVEATTDTAAEMEFLKAQVDALQAQVEQLSGRVTKAEPSWKGAPNWLDKDSGWSFKPKGVLQFDAGYVTLPRKVGGTFSPTGTSAGSGVLTNNLGWGMRARRLIFGAEGGIPGGFTYKFELELSQGGVNYEDMVIGYQKAGSPWNITIGHQYPLSSLELLTSNRFTSFMERAGMTDAFGYGRRLGVTVGYTPPSGTFGFAAGVYGEDVANTNVARTGWQASARAYFSPMMGSTQLHLGAQFQHRVAPRDAQNIRYRQRPYTQITDQRFIDTGAIAADGDDILGVELAAIHGPLHMAAEGANVWVRGYRPGKVFGINNAAGTTNFSVDDPSFKSGYFELGYFLTGETRGYKGGKWDRTKVLKPFTDGGMGAFQINGRIDYTNLNDRLAAGAPVFTGAGVNYINGGRTIGYEASLIWLPIDYVKFMLQYAHSDVSGGPSARGVSGITTPVPTGFQSSYGVDAVTMRAQLDF